ncbi:MAG: hypothetical protein L3J39_16440 [Verrucomicrobiales bacterium]|nr:hypothetical protein [Verrucomicrobiales bacterium]
MRVRERLFDVKLDRESGAYKMDYTDEKEGAEPVVENFVWGASDGLLLSDSESKYEVVKMGEEGKSMPKLVRNFGDGTRESYFFETKLINLCRLLVYDFSNGE